MGGVVELTFSPAARVMANPYRTVSQLADGFERIMQAVNLEISWPVTGGDEALALSMKTRVL
jgi:4-alpha-glucanotransferase